MILITFVLIDTNNNNNTKQTRFYKRGTTSGASETGIVPSDSSLSAMIKRAASNSTIPCVVDPVPRSCGPSSLSTEASWQCTFRLMLVCRAVRQGGGDGFAVITLVVCGGRIGNCLSDEKRVTARCTGASMGRQDRMANLTCGRDKQTHAAW